MCHATELSIMVPKWYEKVQKSMCHARTQPKPRALKHVSGLSQRPKPRVIEYSTVCTISSPRERVWILRCMRTASLLLTHRVCSGGQGCEGPVWNGRAPTVPQCRLKQQENNSRGRTLCWARRQRCTDRNGGPNSSHGTAGHADCAVHAPKRFQAGAQDCGWFFRATELEQLASRARRCTESCSSGHCDPPARCTPPLFRVAPRPMA